MFKSVYLMSKIFTMLQLLSTKARPLLKFQPQIIKWQIIKWQAFLGTANFHTKQPNFDVNKTTTAAGGVLGLGKGKKKVGKLGTMEKKRLPVETDPEKLVNYVCGSNIYITGEDIKIKDDSEYPEWLWSLNIGKAPRIEDLDPNTKQYWIRVRAAGMRRNNRLRSLQRF